MSTPYRTRLPRPLPADTEPIGPPGRRLPRRLWTALVFDGDLWWPALAAPLMVLALLAESAVAMASLAVLTLAVTVLLLSRRLRLLRLLAHGVVVPASLIDRSTKRFSEVEEARTRVLPGWRRSVAIHEGPTLRNVLHVGFEPGRPFARVIRDGGEWDEDLCLLDPSEPSRHVFIADLPPFVQVQPGGGWAYATPRSAPTGSIAEIVMGASGALFCGALAVVGCGLAAVLAAQGR